MKDPFPLLVAGFIAIWVLLFFIAFHRYCRHHRVELSESESGDRINLLIEKKKTREI